MRCKRYSLDLNPLAMGGYDGPLIYSWYFPTMIDLETYLDGDPYVHDQELDIYVRRNPIMNALVVYIPETSPYFNFDLMHISWTRPTPVKRVAQNISTGYASIHKMVLSFIDILKRLGKDLPK